MSGAFQRVEPGARSVGWGGSATSSASIFSASARVPTGTRARSRLDSDRFSRRWRGPATSTSSLAQPNHRHTSGSTSRTAWIRPGRIVSAVVCTSPDRSRTPSGASATVVPYCPLNWRHTPMIAPMRTGRYEALAVGECTTTAMTTMAAMMMTMTTPVMLKISPAARRPGCTWNSTRSSACGWAGVAVGAVAWVRGAGTAAPV